MDERNYRTSPKISFLLGLMAGLAIIGLSGFFITLPKALTCNEVDDQGSQVVLGNTNTDVEDNGEVEPKPSDNKKPAQPSGSADNLVPVKDSEHIRGDKNAKVTLIEYSDFECPYCARHNTTVEQILEEYKGQVRLVFRHFPLSFHAEAQKASEAVECAGDQGKFWEMHDAVFEANTKKQMSVEQWKKVAKDLGLDASAFDSCLDTGKYATKVKTDLAEGQAAGVKGTPATFVNGEMVSGAVPFDRFKTTIDKYLK